MSCGMRAGFPVAFEEFARLNQIVDTEEVYTNGIELIPVFRVEQWLAHVADECKKVDCAALGKLADDLDASASMLLKTNDLDSNRKRRGMRREHAMDLMSAAAIIRRALKGADDGDR